MGYNNQFKKFDPLMGEVPSSPFERMPEIAKRARALLKNRSSEAIIHAANCADWLIDTFYEEEQQQKQGIESGDFPEPWVLKQVIDSYDLDNDPDFSKAKPYEYFAVLALWLVADALEWLEGKTPTVSKAHDPHEQINLSIAGEKSIQAMEALCYAENLHDLEARVGALADEKAKKKISIAASKAAIKRHAENRSMKEQVIQYYSEHEARFKSIEAAAEEISNKLVFAKHRTVVNWIRDFRKLRK